MFISGIAIDIGKYQMVWYVYVNTYVYCMYTKCS